MELDEMKALWGDYDKKLNKSLKLNIELLKKLNMEKVKNTFTKVIFIKLAEISLFLITLGYLSIFIHDNIGELKFVVLAGIVCAICLAAISTYVRQLILIFQLRSGYADDVASMQKKAAELQLLIVNYTKYSFLMIIPMYPVSILLAGKIFFHHDFLMPDRHLPYVLWNLAVTLLFIPLVVWIYRQMSKKQLTSGTIRNLLAGSGWSQVNRVKGFLQEIEEFEREE